MNQKRNIILEKEGEAVLTYSISVKQERKWYFQKTAMVLKSRHVFK